MRRLPSDDRLARRLLLLLTSLCLGGVACNISGQPCGLLNENACTNAGAGGAAGFGCQGLPGENLWECNVDSALGTPLPGITPPPPGNCGVVGCALDDSGAKQWAAGLTGVSPGDARLSCISLGTSVFSVSSGLTTAHNTFNAPGAVCVGMEGPGCNPCDDGQGGMLQSVEEHCGVPVDPENSTGVPTCCLGLSCMGASADFMGICVGTPQCDPTPTTEECAQIKNECIQDCADTSMPTPDYGFKFWNCVNMCMQGKGC